MGVEGGSSSNKRKFRFFLSDYTREDDEFNQRNEDGTLKDLDVYPIFKDDEGNKYTEDGAFPAALQQTPDLLKIWEQMYEVNSKPFYDAESNALGYLPKNLYMLIPSSWETSICDPKNVCGGIQNHNYNLPMAAIAGVYALAKDQYKDVSTNDQIRWAVLRMEAFKAGWYDRQKYCIRKAAPKDSLAIMLKDLPEIEKLIPAASALCGFVPFLTEFYFRTYCACYTSIGATEYASRAERLLRSARMGSYRYYLKPEVLYGTAFGWIGVQRPMHVLRVASENAYIPSVFKTRIHTSTPSGQALITSTFTLIQSLAGRNWWDPIKKIGGYEDAMLVSVAKKIHENPWKYHQMSGSYGISPLTGQEQDEVKEAKEFAAQVSPILQAYLDTIVKNTELGKMKALAKVSQKNMVLYLRMKALFLGVHRKRTKSIDEAFSTYMLPQKEEHD